jgi:hypothetical protein
VTAPNSEGPKGSLTPLGSPGNADHKMRHQKQMSETMAWASVLQISQENGTEKEADLEAAFAGLCLPKRGSH